MSYPAYPVLDGRLDILLPFDECLFTGQEVGDKLLLELVHHSPVKWDGVHVTRRLDNATDTAHFSTAAQYNSQTTVKFLYNRISIRYVSRNDL